MEEVKSLFPDWKSLNAFALIVGVKPLLSEQRSQTFIFGLEEHVLTIRLEGAHLHCLNIFAV